MYQYEKRRQAAYIYCYAVGISVRLRMYDGNGEVVGFRKGTNSYYYLKNLQGDVMKLVNASGTVVAEYEYDDWGKLLVEESSLPDIGRLNPIRYRSYYYDTHSKLYYLNSRYYDPETGRFISADSYGFVYLNTVGFNLLHIAQIIL
ncbi:MAG: hypothetical protein E7218_08200 [Anaerofustis stercorihominis]|nr:hypothetical protein [Anaerofustis stercorihominis]